MQVLTPLPLPSANMVSMNSLKVGDGFLRVGGTPPTTTDNFWILARIDANKNIDMFNPVDGSYITGVAGNSLCVPLPCRIVPI